VCDIRRLLEIPCGLYTDHPLYQSGVLVHHVDVVFGIFPLVLIVGELVGKELLFLEEVSSRLKGSAVRRTLLAVRIQVRKRQSRRDTVDGNTQLMIFDYLYLATLLYLEKIFILQVQVRILLERVHCTRQHLKNPIPSPAAR